MRNTAGNNTPDQAGIPIIVTPVIPIAAIITVMRIIQDATLTADTAFTQDLATTDARITDTGTSAAHCLMVLSTTMFRPGDCVI